VNGVPVALDETAREVNERQVLPAGSLRERIEAVAADNGPTGEPTPFSTPERTNF